MSIRSQIFKSCSLAGYLFNLWYFGICTDKRILLCEAFVFILHFSHSPSPSATFKRSRMLYKISRQTVDLQQKINK